MLDTGGELLTPYLRAVRGGILFEFGCRAEGLYLGPLAAAAPVGCDLHAPEVESIGFEAVAAVLYGLGLCAAHRAAVPDVAAACKGIRHVVREDYTVALLTCGAAAVGNDPPECRARRTYCGKGVVGDIVGGKVFDAHVRCEAVAVDLVRILYEVGHKPRGAVLGLGRFVSFDNGAIGRLRGAERVGHCG